MVYNRIAIASIKTANQLSVLNRFDVIVNCKGEKQFVCQLAVCLKWRKRWQQTHSIHFVFYEGNANVMIGYCKVMIARHFSLFNP